MANYQIDPAHSEITFRVRHLMISTVTGRFETFHADMTSDRDDFTDAVIRFESDINSINTNQTQRDEHLKSPDFFDAANHPKMNFQSSEFVKNADGTYTLHGDLEIRGTRKPVAMQVEYAGKMTDPYGNEKHGFEINGKINRKDFGLNWSAVTEAGGVVVSDEVKISVHVQFVKN